MLMNGERVIGISGGQQHLAVYPNGTIELVKKLNYEDTPAVRFTVQIASKG